VLPGALASTSEETSEQLERLLAQGTIPASPLERPNGSCEIWTVADCFASQ
jgi:hypothetical protein